MSEEPRYGWHFCPQCGETFPKRRPTKRFCSTICRQRHKAGLPPGGADHGTQTCDNPSCQIEFRRRHPEQKFCSTACREKAKRRRRHPKIKWMQRCDYCDAEYQPFFRTQRYCSESCRRLDHREMMYHKHHREKKSRKCHDCGTPTDNYCCQGCWEAIRGAREEEIMEAVDFGAEARM